jgi:hypothetical protein
MQTTNGGAKMITKIRLLMPLDEYQAIEKVAAAEFRDVLSQIRFTLRQDLARRGLLLAEVQSGGEVGQPAEGVPDARQA